MPWSGSRVPAVLVFFALAQTTTVVVAEEAVRTKREASVVENDTDTTLQWPSGRRTEVKVWRSAFVYTSFLNKSLVAVGTACTLAFYVGLRVWRTILSPHMPMIASTNVG